MQCPKCKFDHEAQTTECLRCGIVFRKFVPAVEVAEVAPLTADELTTLQTREEDRRELLIRIFAFPVALLLARGAVSVAPSAVRMLSMWVHESGHAVTAWLCGFSAMPGPWFTSVDPDRSRVTTAFFVVLLGAGGFRAGQKQRWFWIAVCAAILVALLVGTFGLYSDQAQQWIIFGGDAGCFVLGAVLMLTFYARRDHPVYRNALRWGFLVIGALSFMDVWAVWSGGLPNVPFGENENGLSDPSVLTELYSWNINVLIARYQRLGVICLMILAFVYAGGVALPLMRRSNLKQT